MATNDADRTTVESTGDQIETIANKQRGCGYLKEGKAYLRADISADGTLPPFVEFERPVPYLEGHQRNFEHFPGVQFEIAVTGERGMTETNPPGEVWSHLDRIADTAPDGDSLGEMTLAHSHDLLMWVGQTYYESPEAFIDECKTQGLSKAIPVSQRQEPPVIKPGRTRLFLIHPRAVELDMSSPGARAYAEQWDAVDVERDTHVPGVIGYSYLTRTVYTGTRDGDELHFPDFAQDYAAQGELDLVEVGPPEPAEDDDERTLEDFAEATDVRERLRDEVGFHKLRAVASSYDLTPNPNPSTEELIDALVSADVADGVHDPVDMALSGDIEAETQ